MMRISLVTLFSDYYDAVAPGIALEMTPTRIGMELLISSVGELTSSHFVTDVNSATHANHALRNERPDLVVVVPLVAVFAQLSAVSLADLTSEVLLLNVEAPGHRFDLEATGMSDVIRHSACLAVQAIANVLKRANLEFSLLSGRIGDTGFSSRVRTWCLAVELAAKLPTRRLCRFGHAFAEMGDVLLDEAAFTRRFGTAIETVRHTELLQAVRDVSRRQIRDLDESLRGRFEVRVIDDDEWSRSLRLSCAYQALLSSGKFHGGALNSHGLSGLEEPEIGIMSTLAISLLSEEKVSLAEVGDMQTGVALFLGKQLGLPATYAELDYVDVHHNRWFIANSGELDLGMADRTRTVALGSNVNFRGLHGGGAAFDAAFQPGAAALVSFTEGPNETYRLIIADGEILRERSDRLGLVNGTFRPRGGSAEDCYRRWCEAGAVHHAALIQGTCSDALDFLARRLRIDCFHV